MAKRSRSRSRSDRSGEKADSVKFIYSSPLRVYLVLGALSLIGIFCAFRLPVSLFPNSSKPSVTTCIGSEMAPDAFQRFYGSYLEGALRQISEGGLDVDRKSTRL